jgi:hypothetical protein
VVTFQWKIPRLMVRAVNRVLQAVVLNLIGGEEPEVDLLRSLPRGDPILTRKKVGLQWSVSYLHEVRPSS